MKLALPACIGLAVLAVISAAALGADEARPTGLIGHMEYRTNLPGGRRANLETGRAFVVKADATGKREIGSEFAQRPNSSTSFAGWSPDGRYGLLSSQWEDPENAAWEEKNKQFRFDAKHYLVDYCIWDTFTDEVTNVSAVDRVGYYNTVSFFPSVENPTRLALSTMIDAGTSQIYTMNLDGTGKVPMSNGQQSTYGFATSPDGKLIAYMTDYKAYVANADRTNAKVIDTKLPFNFMPQWSPDGEWLLFVGGLFWQRARPYVFRKDGTGLRRLADRGNYRGAVPILDVFDFHEGSSDLPAWSADGRWVYYTCQFGTTVELMRVSLDGVVEQLTHSEPGVLHYHPKPSPDGKWLMFGSTKNGRRNLYISKLDGTDAYPITDVPAGHGAMFGYWQPQSYNPHHTRR